MPKIGIVALDLDGTLLNSDKEITPRTLAALERAAGEGVEIVPSTGRFFSGMPEKVKSLPFIHYAIAVNGAQVVDARTGKSLYAAEIPPQRAVEVMRKLDELPVIYDCYMDGWGWMTRSFWEQSERYAPTKHNLDMLVNLRTPVEDLKAHILKTGHGVQKIQAFFLDQELRLRTMERLGKELSDLVVTTSIVNNVEINSRDAQKGLALAGLARALGLEENQTMAFGDDLNDISMIKAAGVGVAMGNAKDAVKNTADFVTLSCDEDGVAHALEHFLWSKL